MRNIFKKTIASLSVIALSLTLVVSTSYNSYAETQEHIFSRERAVNTGKNYEYSSGKQLDVKDDHFEWDLGNFIVSGFTRRSGDMDKPIFIKTVGDEVTLRFNLIENIDMLNGDDKLIINDEKNAYDKDFGIPKTNFRRGALIVRHTKWNGSIEDATYFNFLSAEEEINANTEIKINEEGDYKVALNYEVKKNFGPFGALSSTSNYRIFIEFSVRNGNCMFFPRDTGTNSELKDNSVTRNGFYIDLVKSRYLNIDIRREELILGVGGLNKNTLFNRPGKDGEKYTEEGIYTIIVSSPYTTGAPTEKTFYIVRDNNLLKAYINSGFDLREMNSQLALGAHIANDGTIVPPSTDSIVYPLDAVTNAELSTNSIATNGFYFDLSNSQHLDINIKRKVLSNRGNELIQDPQLDNNSVINGVNYSEEGIYIITFFNRYTEQHSEMQICVGVNELLKAHINTGLSIDEILNIDFPEAIYAMSRNADDNTSINPIVWLIPVIIVVVLITVLYFYLHLKRNSSKVCCENCGVDDIISKEDESE
jgi:hypothetical protein